MKTKKKNKSLFLLIYVLLISCLFSSIVNILPRKAYAEDIVYTPVLEDLQKDEKFNAESYPVNEKDNSLNVIQIAESTGGELFVYVYNPSGNRVATEIRMSTSIGDNFSPKDYSLVLLNSEGVFSKYKIRNFRIKEDVVRYYDLISIFRVFDENVDKKTGNDNTISEIPFAIAQLWTARAQPIWRLPDII